jgi:hypothetical protein
MVAQASFPLRSLTGPQGGGALALVTDPAVVASTVGLRYAPDSTPGFTRRKAGKGFVYLAPGGRVVRDPGTLRRIGSLAIPPAWTNVWISMHANGHVQATGRDAKGRKQYRYHLCWRATRDETKFHRMLRAGWRARSPCATDGWRRSSASARIFLATSSFTTRATIAKSSGSSRAT